MATQQPLIGPPHLHGEVLNALYQKVRTKHDAKRITWQQVCRADRKFLALTDVAVMVSSSRATYEYAVGFANANGLVSVYDSIYVVLARNLQGELWTADRRLRSNIEGFSEAEMLRRFVTQMCVVPDSDNQM